MQGKIRLLGSGAAFGVPVIGHEYDQKKFQDLKNFRLRTSALITINGKIFLIDPGPDFRQQALMYAINQIDGVLITHTHYDHISGIDELRIYYFLHKKPIELLLSEESFEDVSKRYDYLVDQTTQIVNQDKKFHFHILPQKEGFTEFIGEHFTYFSYEQGHMGVTGYRLGNMAYVTDIKSYHPSIFTYLKGVDLLFVSALRKQQSPVHFNLEEGIQFAKKVGAKQTYFIHISHEITHEEISKELPSNIALGYDGMEVPFHV